MKTNELLSGDDKKPWFRWVLGGFLVWTLLLSITTLNIQHSSSPMIHFPITEHSSPGKTTSDTVTKQKQKNENKGSDKKRPPKPPNLDVIGVVAGVAAVVGLVILAPAAPIALVAGVGIMVWFTVSSALKNSIPPV